MKTSYLQKFNLFIVFCLFLFSAKTSTAQLVAGDLAIIGVNAETTVNPTPRATISFVALTEIPTGTVVHLTDIGYTGSAFVLAPAPPGTTSPDGTANWTVTTKVPAGTVLTVTIQSGVSPTVSILPGNFGSINLDPVSWSHAVAAPIPINAGDSWFLYTGPKTSPDFIYGFTNSKNPDLDEIDESTGWTKDGKTPKNQSSTLPEALKTANAYTSLISFKTVDQQRDFNAYGGTFSGSKSTLLTLIKNPGTWTATDNTVDAKVLTPGTAGGAFPGTQPIYKLGSSVLSVSANPSTGTKGIGAAIVITVNFSDLVNVVSGVPRLKLNSGLNTYATYTTGTGTNTLTFNYTVATGEASPDLNYSSTTALDLNGAILTDPQGDDAIIQLPALIAAESLAGSSSVVIDGISPTILQVNSTSTNGRYISGQTLTLRAVFSEAITVTGIPTLSLNTGGTASYSGGTGTNEILFNYTIAPGENATDLDYTNTTALALNGGTMKDAAGNNATLTLADPSTTGSLGFFANLLVDTTIPTVASISGTNALYNIGSTVPITLNFSEAINVTGIPQLALDVSPAGFASYVSGSGTATLTFNYIVAATQSSADLDYISTTSLSLNGGTLKDLAGNDLTRTLPVPGAPGSLGALSNILINGIRPTILSIARKDGATSLTNATTVEFTVTFSEPVSGVGTSDFSLKAGFPSGSSINSSTPSGSTGYTVDVNTGTGNGPVGIDLNSSGTAIISVAAANAISGGYTAGESYTIDKTAPILTAITILSNSAAGTGLAKAGDIITLNFSTSETINTPVVSVNGNTASVVNTAGNDWVATYTTKASDNNGLVPFSFTYSDLAGNAGTPRGTTTDFSTVFFDKTAPTLTFVSIVANNASYPAYAKAGALVTLSFRASESIRPPTVTIGGATVSASPAGGFNWITAYMLPSGLAEGVVPFTINYTDTYGNTGAQQTTVSTGSMVTLDKTTPTLSNVSISSNNPNPALAKPGDQVTVTFTASEGLATPTVLFYGSASMSIVPQGNNVWTGTGVLSALNTEGAVPFEIRYSDFAGNAGTAVTTTNDVSTVIYDKTLPVAPNFLGVQAGDQQNTMTWFLNSDYAKYELIGGATGGLGNNVLTTVLAANATNPMTFTQTGLINLQTYYYALRVIDAAGNSSTSSTASGTPLNAQTITFDQPIAAEYGSSFTINATSSSGLPVTFTSNEPALATISGNTVTIVGANSLHSVSIFATQPGNANYSYAQPVTRLLQILPKPVTVTATAQTKVFGDVEPALAAPTISPALTGTDVSTGTLARAAGENAGTYEIQQNSFNLDQYKYAITYVPANFTVSKKPVTITPRLAYSKTYGGIDPAFQYNFTPLVSTDAISGSLARVAGEDAGTYNFDLGTLSAGTNYNLLLSPLPQFTINNSTITVTPITASIQYGDAEPVIGYNFTPELKPGDAFTGALSRAPGNTPNSYLINQGTLALSNNYTLNFIAVPVNFLVLKKNISITPTAGQGKIYGDLDGTINYAASPTLLNGDTFSGALGRTAGSAVADYQISMGSLVASNPGNYNLQLSTENYAITRKPIMVTATAVNQVYGDTDPVSLPYTLSTPLATGDSFTGKLARTAGTAVGSYPVNQGNLALGSNYDLNFTTADLTITPKAIAITAVSGTKTYGDADPVFTYTGSSALIAGDSYTGMLGRVSGENTGNYALTLGNLKVTDNYTLTLNPGAALTISKKGIQVIAQAKSKVYGSADPVLSYSPNPALVAGDSFSGLLSRMPGENKGTYPTTPGSLTAGPNYSLTFTAANLTIDPAPLTVTADAKSKFAGTANPVFTGQYAGFVNGEDASVLTSPAVYTSIATVASPIGTYPIVPSGATALNYTITPVNGVLTVKAGAPTAVLFAGNTIYENQASGTLAGKLSSTSDDTQAIFTYSLVSGSGDTDNASFRIAGDQLLTTASLDYENKKVYSVLVRSTTQHGFSLDKSFTINLSDVNEIPTLNAIANLAICYTTGSQTIDLTGISTGPETGQNASITVTGSNAALLQSLTVSAGSGSSGKGTLNYRIKNGASGVSTITVTVKDNGGTDNGGVDTYSRTFVLTVNALPVVAITADKGTDNNPNSTSVSKGETVVLTASGGSSYAWAVSNSAISGQNSASLTVRPRETTTYTVTVSNANGCTEQKSFTVTVLDDLEKIKATNVLSPNGDGYNDNWIIDNIDFYPNNEVKIFDKSGRAVYSKKGYDNSWDGMLNGAPLSEGTYFYIIDFGKDRLKFKGFITIVREN